jgi:hypothetical protein
VHTTACCGSNDDYVTHNVPAAGGGAAAALAGIYTAALDSRFLQASSQQEAAVMARHLGVSAPSAAAVYRDVLLPQLRSLQEVVRDAAMLHMLRCLGDLQQQDRMFTQLLAQVGTVLCSTAAV